MNFQTKGSKGLCSESPHGPCFIKRAVNAKTWPLTPQRAHPRASLGLSDNSESPKA